MIGERLLRVARHAFIILVALAWTTVLSAQTVVDPQYVEFTPSADHNGVASDGTPLVQRYSLSIFAEVRRSRSIPSILVSQRRAPVSSASISFRSCTISRLRMSCSKRG